MNLYKRSSIALRALSIVTLAFAFSHGAVSDTARVNCGGSAYTDSAGHAWAADSGFSGGQTYSSTSAFANTPDQTLYQTERWDSQNFSYNFNVNPGSHIVSLYEASNYAAVCNSGGRVFDVSINGDTVLKNYDMYNEVGCLYAQIKQFVVPTTDGKINITFILGSASNPKIDAISIVPGNTVSIFKNTTSANLKQSLFSVSNLNGALSVQTQTEGAYSLELSNLQGQRLGQKYGFGSGSQSFKNLNPGLYFMTLHANHQNITRMVSVMR